MNQLQASARMVQAPAPPELLAPPDMKWCHGCGWKAQDAFYSWTTRARCKACARQQTRAWMAANAAHVRKYQRAYRRRTPSARKAYNAQYYHKHREKLLAQKTAQRAAERAAQQEP